MSKTAQIATSAPLARTTGGGAAAQGSYDNSGSGLAAEDVQAAIDELAAAGAPTTADYLVGTAQAGLSAEIVVGATPGGELGNTWASPTVDATHSGSTHSAATDTHIADASDAHDASAISFAPTGTIAATDVQAAIAEVASEGHAHGIGTSFPGSPATNDFYYRSDRHIDYYYDGTRWLSKTLYVQPLAVGDAVQPAATNQVVLRGVAALSPTYDAFIQNLYLASKVITTNSGAHFWAIALSKHPATTALTYQQTDADTVNVWTSHINAVNALVATTEFELEVSAIKGGAPGNLYLVGSVTYRLVG